MNGDAQSDYPSPKLPSGTVTFLFTDIEGSTRLWQKNPETMPESLARHHALLHEGVNSNHGYVFQIIGDAFCSAFESAADGLSAAITIQRALQDEEWGETGPIRVRMALHTGLAEVRVGDHKSGEYVSGFTLSRVARLLSVGHGGQILLSSAAAEMVSDYLPEKVTLREMGAHQLRDVDRIEIIYQVVVPDLPLEFPQLKTYGMHQNNLPMELSSFVGRDKELAEVLRYLGESSIRLLTLIGPPGVGKTRIALQAAREALDVFQDGVWLVELAAKSDSQQVPLTVASTMGLEIRNGSYSALLKVLVSVAQRKDLLLLLDNCEHLLDGVVTFVGDLLRECPQLAFLATSREPLAITGEITYSVPAMYFPSAQAKVDQVIASDAVRLFVERASAVMPGYKIKRDNAQAIGQICRHLDGIPLAIELAAARVRSLSSNEIADRLEDRFRLLTGGSRIELPRLKTLFGSIEWSYELLTEEEQKIFNRSSVFRGGFMLSEAEKVCEGGGIHAADVLHLLTDLVDKSLVVAKRTRDGFARYQLLESLRQFGKDRLSNLGEYDQYSHKHALTYMDLAEEAEPFLEGPEEISWLKRLEPELDNVMAAVRWSLENGFEEIVIRLLAALHVYFMERKQHVPRAADFMSEALTKVGVLESEIQMKGLWTKAVWALYLWDLDEAERLINDTIELAHLHENELMLAKSLNSQASLNMKRGNYEGARDCFEKSFKMFEDLGNKIYLAETNRFLALCVTSNTERVRLLETALGLAREEGIPFMIGVIQSDLGRFHTENTGDLDKANQYFLGALSSSKEREAKYSQSVNNWHLGYIALLRGDYPLATSYFDESREASRRSGIVDMDAWSSLGLAELHRVQREYSLADQLLRDSLEIWDRFPSPGGHVETLITSALVARDKGDYSRAEAISKVALQMAVEHNLEEVHGWVLSILADIKHHSGDLEESIELYRQSLEIRRNAYFYRVLEILEGLAILAVNRKLFELATKLFAAVDQARIVSGIVIPPPRQENHDRAFDTLQRTYDEIKFQEAWSEGILLTLEQAREYALDVLHELN